MTSKPQPLTAPWLRLADTLRPLAGRRIALIAPAGGVSDERIDTTLAVLAAAGIDVHLGAHARDHHRYLAGTTTARLADLHAAFEVPDVAAVWCLRGGYGSAQLVDGIDWSRIPAQVPLVGFSDITALLEVFRRQGRPAIHGPVATQLALPGESAAAQDDRVASLASLVAHLLGRSTPEWHLQSVTDDKTVRGRLVGGNLTVLASLVGTPAALQLSGPSILVLEDVGEAEFRLERCLFQVLQSVAHEPLAAVVLGQFRECTLGDGMASWQAICAERLAGAGVSLYANAPIGHGVLNHAWHLDAQASIQSSRLSLTTTATQASPAPSTSPAASL